MRLKRILKGSQVAEIDKKCINDGIDSKWLMKNAGEGVGKIIIKDFTYRKVKDKLKGVIICGKGNNGGDGFVAADILINSGIDIALFYLTPSENFSSDSIFYFKKLRKKENTRLYYLKLDDEETTAIFRKNLKEANFIVDAIFGTGISGRNIYGPAEKIINDINQSREKDKNTVIYSIDIPSGVDSNNGMILGTAVKADVTVTFECKKLGLASYPGVNYAGIVKVIDIGIPKKYYGNYEQIFEADLEWVAGKIPQKEPWTYKHKVGKLLVIAGSIGLTGAATMTCLAALRSGAGIVTLVCPWELNSIFEEKLTEVMTYPVEQTEDVSIHMDSLDNIVQISEDFDALAIGPGISKNPSTICLVREILGRIKKPTVLDADGLRALYGPREIVKSGSDDLSHVVITPHSGELAAILGIERVALHQRLQANLEVVKKYGLTSVLKGASTLISNYNKRTFINPTGDWALATAGTGDILTGVIGSLLSQGLGITESAVCGVFIHGMSSDIVKKYTSRTSLIATDLLEGIKKVFLKIEKMKY